MALTTKTAVFHIGSRRQEELSHLVTEAFLGWLVTDGYAASAFSSQKTEMFGSSDSPPRSPLLEQLMPSNHPKSIVRFGLLWS